MKLEREVVVRRGGLLARIWDQIINALAGRKLVECYVCLGTGVSSVRRVDWRPEVDRHDATGIFTTCRRCSGTGWEWR